MGEQWKQWLTLFFWAPKSLQMVTAAMKLKDREAWRAAIHGVTKSRTRLSNFTFTFHLHALDKEMATHSSILAWRIPGTGEPGGLLSMLVIAFLPRSKHFLISRLQSPSAVILEPKKIKSVTVSLSICNEVMGPDAMILVF